MTALGTMLRIDYPCCGRSARLVATPGIPRETYDRDCQPCGCHWTIRRTTLTERGSGPSLVRADRLDWEEGTYDQP